MSTPDLRHAVQSFVRDFGLLSADRTPCGADLPPATAHALQWLLEAADRPGRPNQQELQAVLGLDKSNIARLCARLESAGLVRRRIDQEDRRSRRIQLTPKGRRLAEKVEAASRERFDGIMATIPHAERRTVVMGIERLVRALEQYRAEAA